MSAIPSVFRNLPSLETERLLLRKMTLDDADDMFAYASDPEITRFVVWEAHRDREDSLIFLRVVIGQYASGTPSPWGIVLKESGRLVGTIGFIEWHPEHARVEVGYAICRFCWNRGLMTEALHEVLRFGFRQMSMNRIEARCLVPNQASARVMEKAGMSFEGVLREQIFEKGAFRDLKLYSILRREYEASCAAALFPQALTR